MSKRQRRRAGHIFCGILAIALALSRTAGATQPSVLVYVVDIDSLGSIAAEHFAADAAARLHADLQAGANAAPPLINPSPDRYTALSQISTTGLALRTAWRAAPPTLDRRHRFESFLAAVNDAGVVRALISSPGYQGCLGVELSLRQRAERLVLHENLSAFAFDGCSQLTSERPFKTSNILWLD